MKKPVPDFAIFQNDRTKASALWIKEVGEWQPCASRDFEPLQVMVNLLRHSPDPKKTLVMIAKIIAKTNESDL